MELHRNHVVKTAVIMAIIAMASGSRGGYGNIQDDVEFSDRRNNRPTQQNRFINREKEQLGRDKQELIDFFERAGQVIGEELLRGSKNDRIWNVYDKMKRQAKATGWYSRLEVNVGQEDIEMVFRTFQRKIRSQIFKARDNLDRVNKLG